MDEEILYWNWCGFLLKISYQPSGFSLPLFLPQKWLRSWTHFHQNSGSGATREHPSVLKGPAPERSVGVCTWETHSFQEVLNLPQNRLSLTHFFPSNVTYVVLVSSSIKWEWYIQESVKVWTDLQKKFQYLPFASFIQFVKYDTAELGRLTVLVKLLSTLILKRI